MGRIFLVILSLRIFYILYHIPSFTQRFQFCLIWKQSHILFPCVNFKTSPCILVQELANYGLLFELKMVFIFLNSWGGIKIIFHDTQKLREI